MITPETGQPGLGDAVGGTADAVPASNEKGVARANESPPRRDGPAVAVSRRTSELSTPAQDALGLRAIACVLHDDVAQELLAARVSIEELIDTFVLPEEARFGLERIAAQLADSSGGLHSALHSLFAGASPGVGGCVTDRLRNCLRAFQNRSNVTVDLEIEGSAAEPTGVEAEILVRAAKEGLANIAKHANATEVLMVIRRCADCWAVEIHDDGVGSPGDVYASLSTRQIAFGLASLRDDIGRLGGRMTISESRWQHGLSLVASVPVRSTSTRPLEGAVTQTESAEGKTVQSAVGLGLSLAQQTGGDLV